MTELISGVVALLLVAGEVYGYKQLQSTQAVIEATQTAVVDMRAHVDELHAKKITMICKETTDVTAAR